MSVLFLDHEDHLKTCSSRFLVEILRTRFKVAEHYYSRHYHTGVKEAMAGQDAVVVLEFPIARNRFFIRGKRNVFVPMYDNEWGSFWQWKRIAWSGMGIVSFCDKVSAHARRCGVTNLLDVRYFPDPAALPQKLGDSKKVFLWERTAITRQMAEMLFPPDEGYTFVIKGAHDFWPREEYLERIASCGIVIAPRQKEGIGMAFLEAMAMGKCVVAHDDATMNEYIRHGESGLLFDVRNPQRMDFADVERVRANLSVVVKRYHARWLDDKDKIVEFISAQKPNLPNLSSRAKLVLSYPLYLMEGAMMKVRRENALGKVQKVSASRD